MRRYLLPGVCLIFLLAVMVFLFPAAAGAQQPVVRAVLFHSPTCPHCKTVIEEVLPPLQEQFGDQLDILMVDASTDDGYALYTSMQETFKPGDGRRGVPALVVGKQLLVGSREIPDEFPGIIEKGLERGGIDWPKIPGLENYVTITPTVEETGTGLDQIVAWATLAALVITFVANGYRLWSRRAAWVASFSLANSRSKRNWLVPLLSVIGFAIAWYLANKEITQTSVACGPLAGCDTVQNSKYATFFWLPVGVWGMIAYAFLLVLWGVAEFGIDKQAKSNPGNTLTRLSPFVRPLMLVFSFICVLFSTYLTILEVGFIKATCTWCIGSALVTTAINWVLAYDGNWLPAKVEDNARK